jgi:hypothetical protein
VRSNDALNALALGGTTEDALATWNDPIQGEHLESKFYPAVVAFRAGNLEGARVVVSALEGTEVEDARLMAEGARAESKIGSWAAQWFTDCLALLDDAGPGQ